MHPDIAAYIDDLRKRRAEREKREPSDLPIEKAARVYHKAVKGEVQKTFDLDEVLRTAEKLLPCYGSCRPDTRKCERLCAVYYWCLRKTEERETRSLIVKGAYREF